MFTQWFCFDIISIKDGVKMNDRLKKVRNNLKLSQAKLAEEMHVTRNVIANYESGRVEPTDIFITLLCSKYRINEEWFRFGTGEMQIGESKESIIASITANLFNSVESDIRFKLIKIVNNLSDEQLETFRDIAKQLLEESDNQGE